MQMCSATLCSKGKKEDTTKDAYINKSVTLRRVEESPRASGLIACITTAIFGLVCFKGAL